MRDETHDAAQCEDPSGDSDEDDDDEMPISHGPLACNQPIVQS